MVGHRHVATGREIKNCEATTTQADVGTVGETLLPEAEVVGTAVNLDVRHPTRASLFPQFTKPLIPHTDSGL